MGYYYIVFCYAKSEHVVGHSACRQPSQEKVAANGRNGSLCLSEYLDRLGARVVRSSLLAVHAFGVPGSLRFFNGGPCNSAFGTQFFCLLLS